MSITRKLIGTTDVASGPAIYVEDVFSTHLYTGTGASQTINNGIDLATYGGLVWTKMRNAGESHALVDTARGASKYLMSDSASTEFNIPDFTGFSTTGYTLGSDVTNKVNASSKTYASWTFRKQAKFFDVVTFSGNSSARAIAHSLGATPGMIIIKTLNDNNGWVVYHKSQEATKLGVLNQDLALGAPSSNFYTNVTSSSFGVGTDSWINGSGNSYVAYLFAESNSGGFGPAGTDSVVACGQYTGNGSASGPTVTLGWEPQFVMIKNASATGNWNIFDNMRGIATGGNDPYLFANTSAAEATTNGDLIDLTPTGFVIRSTNSQVNTSSNNYIYLAIRRGPMKTPTDATKVLSVTTGDSNSVGFPVDLIFSHYRDLDASARQVRARLSGYQNCLLTSSTAAQSNVLGLTVDGFASNTGFNRSWGGGYVHHLFRRAPGFFDVVCYAGNGGANTIPHNLKASPEILIIKDRTGSSAWEVEIRTGAVSTRCRLNQTDAETGPVANVSSNSFSFSAGFGGFNVINTNYVAYLFATCPGVSKVGSYTGNGSSQTIDCGFAAGARFILIKRTSAAGDWYVWDTARGIVAGNDPHISLNSTAAEVTTNDTIDTAGSGFVVNQDAATNVNVSSATYIYLAIA